MKKTPLFRGAVLAGGHSRRMGHDKAQLILDGEMLWRRQIRVLTQAGASPVTLVRRAGQDVLAQDAPCVLDQFEGVGPLAGLHAALTRADPADWIAVLAVDMPLVNADWFETLRSHVAPGVGAVMRHEGGVEPLAAIYPQAALALVEERLRAKTFSLHGLVNALAAVGRIYIASLPTAMHRQTTNCNTPGDLAECTPHRAK